jgi:hypothetical protein
MHFRLNAGVQLLADALQVLVRSVDAYFESGGQSPQIQVVKIVAADQSFMVIRKAGKTINQVLASSVELRCQRQPILD